VRRTWASLVLLLLTMGCDRGQHPRQVDTVAPEFSLTDGSQSVDLANLRGKIVLVNFWASWCAPCIEELPTLIELQRKMPEVTVVAISTDEDENAYKTFLTKNHIDLKTIWDGKQRVNTLYGTFRYPETYVIDRKGMMRRKFIGPQTWTSPEIMEYLAKL
jgi:cytochrome c biogenesis protein CcmG/thiol:disulfide interchange protein DsbE